MITRFDDRRHAGQLLAEKLSRLKNAGDLPLDGAIVIALPRGGLPVAYEVAENLNLPLDVFVVRKIGAPFQPELAIGAVVEGGEMVVNEEIIRSLGISRGEVRSLADEKQKEIAERIEKFRSGRAAVPVQGRVVILVDDGIATGATALSAIHLLKKMQAKKIVLALPVAPIDTANRFRLEVDRLVVLQTPPSFSAVGEWYKNFDQVSGDEVVEYLRRAHMSTNLEVEKNKSIELARAAGKIAQDIRARKTYEIVDKGGGLGPVSEADRAANEYLVQELRKAFPQDEIVAEESPLPTPALEAQRIWFVDPIDGTREFIQDSAEWSVMIGLAIQGRAVLGVVYQPDSDRLYYATRGGGAYLQTAESTQKLQVRNISDPKDAVLIQSRSHRSREGDRIARELNVKNTVPQASIGLKFARIGEGTADLYFNFSGQCHLWDLCGPEVILRESGASLVFSSGREMEYKIGEAKIKDPYFASAPGLVEKVRPYFKK